MKTFDTKYQQHDNLFLHSNIFIFIFLFFFLIKLIKFLLIACDQK